MGKKKNKLKHVYNNTESDSEKINNLKQNSDNDSEEFQEVKTTHKVNMFQLLKQSGSDEDTVNSEKVNLGNLETKAKANLGNSETSKVNLETKTNLETSKVNLETKTNLETSRINLDTSKINLDTSKINLETSKINLETSKINLETNKVNLKTNKENLETNKENLGTKIFSKIISDFDNGIFNPENYTKDEFKQSFKYAYSEDIKGNVSLAIKYYKILSNSKYKYTEQILSIHNLAHIYWDLNQLDTALEYFEKACKLKYLDSMCDYAFFISENLNKFEVHKQKAMEYFKIYLLLKNATPEEKKVYFDLFF